MAFSKGERIQLIKYIGNGWYLGENQNSEVGLVPINYFEDVESDEEEMKQPPLQQEEDESEEESNSPRG